jgi:hypothetical protein
MALSHNKKRDRDAARFAGWDDIDPSFFAKQDHGDGGPAG